MSVKVTVVTAEAVGYPAVILSVYSDHAQAAAVCEALEAVYDPINEIYKKERDALSMVRNTDKKSVKYHAAMIRNLDNIWQRQLQNILKVKRPTNLPLDATEMSFGWSTAEFTNASIFGATFE